jgi:hypothetical protein
MGAKDSTGRGNQSEEDTAPAARRILETAFHRRVLGISDPDGR